MKAMTATPQRKAPSCEITHAEKFTTRSPTGVASPITGRMQVRQSPGSGMNSPLWTGPRLRRIRLTCPAPLRSVLTAPPIGMVRCIVTRSEPPPLSPRQGDDDEAADGRNRPPHHRRPAVRRGQRLPERAHLPPVLAPGAAGGSGGRRLGGDLPASPPPRLHRRGPLGYRNRAVAGPGAARRRPRYLGRVPPADEHVAQPLADCRLLRRGCLGIDRGPGGQLVFGVDL